MAAPRAGSAHADWVNIFFSVLPPLPLCSGSRDDGRLAAALRAGTAALITQHSAAIRAAGVAVWEVRLRVSDGGGAWRVVAELPTGERRWLAGWLAVL